MTSQKLKSYRESLQLKERQRYQVKMGLIAGRDPYMLAKEDLKNDAKCLPAVTYIDIVNYLINAKSAYTFEQLKAYKSMEAMNQLCCGWVRDVQSMTVESNVLVLAKVCHSQMLNAAPLRPWIIANKDGTIEAAHCDCKAGLGETCSHVGALLFYVESAHRLVTQRTVTQEKAYWCIPSAIDKVPYATIRQIDFTSVATKKRRFESRISGGPIQQRSSQKLPDVPRPSAADRLEILHDLHRVTKASVLTVSSGFQDQYVPKILQDGNLPQPLSNLRDDKYLEMEPELLRQHCLTILKDVTVTPEQAVNVERLTREQNKCKEWFHFRLGRITASNMKAVCDYNSASPASSTIQAVCGRKPVKTKATDYGLKHEGIALSAYTEKMCQQHENFFVKKCGLFLNGRYSHVGATPDGIVQCDCCGVGLVEVKCPYTAKEKGLSSVDYIKEGHLIDKHKYKYQIQTQLTVTQKAYCDFVVWSPTGMFIQRIEPDQALEEEILKKSEDFFLSVVLPEMTGSLLTRERLHKQQSNTLFNNSASPDGIPVISTAPQQTRSQSAAEDGSTTCSALRCVCGERSETYMSNTVKCANEKCQYGFLHFKCVGIKRNPKPPYYCPTCRKVMW
ncbi:unnamed protein product [Knipowitschia caucasica]